MTLPKPCRAGASLLPMQSSRADSLADYDKIGVMHIGIGGERHEVDGGCQIGILIDGRAMRSTHRTKKLSLRRLEFGHRDRIGATPRKTAER